MRLLTPSVEVENEQFKRGPKTLKTRRPRSGLKVVRPLTVPIFPFLGGGGGCSPANFWCQVQKCWNPNFHFWGGGGGGGVAHHQLSKSKVKFSKSNPELKFPFLGGGGGGGGCSPANFWCQVQKCWNPNFHSWGGGGGGVAHHQLSKSKVKFSKSNPELKFPFRGGGGGGVAHLLTFDGEFKFAKIKNFFYKGFFKNFLSFRAKIGTVGVAKSDTEWFVLYIRTGRTTIICCAFHPLPHCYPDSSVSYQLQNCFHGKCSQSRCPRKRTCMHKDLQEKG